MTEHYGQLNLYRNTHTHIYSENGKYVCNIMKSLTTSHAMIASGFINFMRASDMNVQLSSSSLHKIKHKRRIINSKKSNLTSPECLLEEDLADFVFSFFSIFSLQS